MRDRRRPGGFVVCLGILLWSQAAVAANPATKCKTDKMIAAGSYDLCLLRTIARATRAGVTPNLTDCAAQFNARWAKAETKRGGACPTTGDATAITSQVNGDVSAIIAALMPPAITTASTTTTTVPATTGTTVPSCGTFPGCGGVCPPGLSCWAAVASGPVTGCSCLPAVATPCTSTGGGLTTAPLCGGACPAGEVCSTIAVTESLDFTCGCMPSGSPACLSFGGPCGGTCPTGMSCGADPLGLFACACQ